MKTNKEVLEQLLLPENEDLLPFVRERLLSGAENIIANRERIIANPIISGEWWVSLAERVRKIVCFDKQSR